MSQHQTATNMVFCLMHLKEALKVENFYMDLTKATFLVKSVLGDIQIRAKCYQVISQVLVVFQYFLIMDLMLKWTSILITKI